MKIALVVLYIFSADGGEMTVAGEYKTVAGCERALSASNISATKFCWTVYVNR